ncbi:hypothetical protein ANCCAN_24225 [Ancylostoma caninum]|uniref:Tc1-like transposase DDE domain-containing protein n=1 Tax=Ancylostoma caninum TaxID=29170 RepID=A0A368FD12_ANCCA|nr:hypothetical protein ANCCAN_24225 [Ancylostoma caninum]
MIKRQKSDSTLSLAQMLAQLGFNISRMTMWRSVRGNCNIIRVLISRDENEFNLDDLDRYRHYWRDLWKEPLMFSRPNFGGGSRMTCPTKTTLPSTSLILRELAPGALHICSGRPAFLSDCNQVENMWAIIVRHVYRNKKHYSTVDDLRAMIVNVWDKIGDNATQNLVKRMPRRVFEVIRNVDGPTNH